jgi:hypothetical protein
MVVRKKYVFHELRKLMRRLLIAILSISFVLTGCSVNPVTGESNFILPNLDEGWERQVGEQMYAPMRQSQGGDYILDPEFTARANNPKVC